jgi:hypothetical protein
LIAFLALARKEAKLLTALFCEANLLLVVPVRQPLTVAALAGLALLGLLRVELRRFDASAQLATLEGRLARVVLFAPPVTMLGRVFHLYHPGVAFIGGVLLIGASCLWLLLARTQNVFKGDAGAWLAGAAGSYGWLMCWLELREHIQTDAAAVLLLGLPAAALFGLAAARAASARNGLIGMATGIALATTLVACAFNLTTLSALVCVGRCGGGGLGRLGARAGPLAGW